MTTAGAWRRAAIVGAAFAWTAVAAATEGAPPRQGLPDEGAGAPARVIVKFRAGAATVRNAPLDAVRLSAGTASTLQARADAVGRRLGLSLATGRAVADRVQVVTATGLGSDVLARRLQQDADVEYAVVDRRYARLAAPADPLYVPVPGTSPAVGQWYLKAPAGGLVSPINAAAAWDTTLGVPTVVVAVLDTGVRRDHPDLANQLLAGYDFVGGPADATSLVVANDGNGRDADPSDPGDWATASDASVPGLGNCSAGDSSWHGTQVSGLVAAAQNNGIGMTGVAPGAQVLPVRVLGKCGGYESDIAAGMLWAAGIAVPGVPVNPTPAKVLNLSLGGTGTCSAAYADAIGRVIAAGASVVVAAGNSSGHALGSPANCAGVIAVGGVRHVGTKVGYSDVGTGVTLSAPAGNCENPEGPCLYPLLSTTNRGTTTPVPGDASYTDGRTIANAPVGTSFAAPLVAGTAALMLSVNPSLTPAQVTALLKGSVRPFPSTGGSASIAQCRPPNGIDQLECYCTTTTCGAGLLDVRAAVQAAAGGATATAITAAIAATPARPSPGDAVQLSAAGSVLPAGRTLASATWSLVDGGGIVSGFESTTSTTATLRPTGPGTFTVNVVVQDSAGLSDTEQLTVRVDTLTAAVSPAASALAVGDTVRLAAQNLVSTAGPAVTYGWAVTEGTGVVSLSGGASGEAVDVRADAAGTAKVQLTVTDANGKQATAVWTGTVGTPAAADTGSGSGGGGAIGPGALLGLLVLAIAGAGSRPRRGRGAASGT